MSLLSIPMIPEVQWLGNDWVLHHPLTPTHSLSFYRWGHWSDLPKVSQLIQPWGKQQAAFSTNRICPLTPAPLAVQKTLPPQQAPDISPGALRGTKRKEEQDSFSAGTTEKSLLYPIKDCLFRSVCCCLVVRSESEPFNSEPTEYTGGDHDLGAHMLSAPAHLGEGRLKDVQDTLGICQAEPFF